MAKFKDEIVNIDLFITERCNLACEYCFAPKSDNDLTFEAGKKILDCMFELTPSRMTVTFFGGEPFLLPELMLELMDYATTLWKENVKFHVVTNGTYYNEEIFRKLRQYPFSIQVSLDGDEKTHMEHRGGDFEKICLNTLNILAIFPEASVRMTFTPKTVGRLAMNVQFLHQKLGFKRIMHHAVMEADWQEEDIQKYMYQLTQIYNYRRWVLRSGEQLEIAFIDKPLGILNGEAKPDTVFCEAGRSYAAMLPNGDVYPCHRAASARIFQLGNIFEEIPFIRGVFQTMDKNFTGCSKNCEASATCHSCIITHHKVNGDLAKPISQYCKICQIENQLARQYLPTEIADRHGRVLAGLSRVIADVATQQQELVKLLTTTVKLLGGNDGSSGESK